jgi:hypothetical protein
MAGCVVRASTRFVNSPISSRSSEQVLAVEVSSMLAQKIDFDGLMEPVALRLLGEPNQKHGNEWRYGNRGSLSIDLTNGRWFDHEADKGGGVFDLIRRQGHEQPVAWLRREGLMASQPHVVARTEPRIVKTYDYRDERGVQLFQVVRFEPKDFRQRCPDGNGGWIWSLGDTRRVPYLLPELVKAVAAGETIYIPEGEKDTDNLRAIGLAATTNPGGIKKWRDEYSEYLHGADVVVLPDNHSEGREHGEQVVASLRGLTRRIRVLDIGKHWPDCPEKGDISDWLAAGGSAEKLREVTDALPEWTPAEQPQQAADAHSVVNVVSVVWPEMAGVAYHGLAGNVVRIIEPHSEADTNALLVQFLTVAGNLMGRTAYYQVESDRHHPSIFSVMVGDSSKARKGTSWGRVRALGSIADPEWFGDRVKGGLSSGEGLIDQVRDERREWNKKTGCEEVVDSGVKDKRLMVVEPEFASALSVAERHGNTISPIIRNAWDGVKLATLVKNSPLSATGAHISILGHVTIDELRARITRTDLANGFANRFIFVLVKRSKLLPHGGDLDDRDLESLGQQLREAVAFANTVGRVTMTTDAREAWSDIYGDLGAEGIAGRRDGAR